MLVQAWWNSIPQVLLTPGYTQHISCLGPTVLNWRKAWLWGLRLTRYLLFWQVLHFPTSNPPY